MNQITSLENLTKLIDDYYTVGSTGCKGVWFKDNGRIYIFIGSDKFLSDYKTSSELWDSHHDSEGSYYGYDLFYYDKFLTFDSKR